VPALPASGYRPRSSTNALKDIVEDSIEELFAVWDARFRATYGPLTRRVRDLCERFVRCGDLHFGFLRLRCSNPDCPKKEEKLVPYSCKTRGYAKWVNMLSARASPRVRLRVFQGFAALGGAIYFAYSSSSGILLGGYLSSTPKEVVMLEFFIDSEFKLRQLRSCPVGEHMDGFADRLHSAGYRRRPAQLILRGAAHLGHWASVRDIQVDGFDQPVLDSFFRHLARCACTHAFRGRTGNNAQGARHFVEHLQRTGILTSSAAKPEPLPALIEAFSDWMHRHRGVADSTLANHVPVAKEFLSALGDDPAAYDASRIRSFIFSRASRTGHSRAKQVMNTIRMFLRFLSVRGYCSPDLLGAVPRIAQWRLSSLPRFISAQDVERVIATCDPTDPRGSRDRAVILLLARLALRAGDVRDLRLTDICWSRGRLRVVGKGRCETWLPLPQDAGDAVLEYLDHCRPASEDDHVFLRVHAPFGPLPSSGPISKLVRRAIVRAGVKSPSLGAHVLRHSAATEMLRLGSSLDVIGAVLRHRSVESTAHYAKVDLTLLRSVAQPWPVDGGSPC